MSPSAFTYDCIEFISLLNKYEVKWVIVGGEAVIYYGHVRLTGDVDFFYKNDRENSEKLINALNEFWDYNIPGGIKRNDLMAGGNIIQFGLPPNRIDLISEIEGVDFDEVWENKVKEELNTKLGKLKVYYIGLGELIKNKSSVNRPKDLEDLKFLKSITK